MAVTTNSRVRLYRAQAREYIFADYPCSVSYKHRVVSSSNGAAFARECSIRIFTTDALPFGLGDYAAVGGSESDKPDKTKCIKITDVHDNRRGNAPHWRLIFNE